LNVCNKCKTELSEDELIEGCYKCGNKTFRFVNTKDIEEKKCKTKKKENMENALDEGLTIDENSVESIKVEDKGVYEVNLHQVLEGETAVFSDNEGNYVIDINSLLKKGREKKTNNTNLII